MHSNTMQIRRMRGSLSCTCMLSLVVCLIAISSIGCSQGRNQASDWTRVEVTYNHLLFNESMSRTQQGSLIDSLRPHVGNIRTTYGPGDTVRISTDSTINLDMSDTKVLIDALYSAEPRSIFKCSGEYRIRMYGPADTTWIGFCGTSVQIRSQVLTPGFYSLPSDSPILTILHKKCYATAGSE